MDISRAGFALAPVLALAAPQAQAAQTAFKVSFMIHRIRRRGLRVSRRRAKARAGRIHDHQLFPRAGADGRAHDELRKRASQWRRVSADDHRADRINVVSPDGTGSINNYMALYVTNNPRLVAAFQSAGMLATQTSRSPTNTRRTAPAAARFTGRCCPANLAPIFFMGRRRSRRRTAPSPSSPTGGMAPMRRSASRRPSLRSRSARRM